MAYDLDAEDRHRAAMTRETPGAHRRTFRPVVVRERHDGWTTAKQADFIAALGECGCVTDACAAVGMTTASAYRLKARYDAVDFRLAWDAALDVAIDRIEDGVVARAIHGVAVPHYYQGEQVGEHRRYDERLAMFVLRYRKPYTYGKFRDRQWYLGDGHSEEQAERFAIGIDRVGQDISRTMIEDEAAEAAAAHLARDTANAASAAASADRAALQAETAAARAAATGDATDARIARETEDWAVGLAHDAIAAEAQVAATAEWAAHAAATIAARAVRTNQAGGEVPQPSHTSAHDANQVGSATRAPAGERPQAGAPPAAVTAR